MIINIENSIYPEKLKKLKKSTTNIIYNGEYRIVKNKSEYQ